MRGFDHFSGVGRFADEMVMLADKPAKFCKFGSSISGYSLLPRYKCAR
jgi:hypothetical protein